MLKKIKSLKKVGIYQDFTWSDTSCFKKYNAFYGFNGCGKTTLAKAFQALDGSKLDFRETGTSAIFENYDSQSLEIRDDTKHIDILVYDEDFITNNLKWDQGIKSFVVIGKKSKEQEEQLRMLLNEKNEIVIQKKITEADVKKTSDLLDSLATTAAGNLKTELLSHNTTKYRNYTRRNFQQELISANPQLISSLAESEKTVLLEKINQTPLETVSPIDNIVSTTFLENINSAFTFLSQPLPTKKQTSLSQQQIAWLEEGLKLHEGKSDCLLCTNTLTEARKQSIQEDLTDEVASYIKKGKAIVTALSQEKLQVKALLAKQFYSENIPTFESIYSTLTTEAQSVSNLKLLLIEYIERSVSFETISPTITENDFKNELLLIEKLRQEMMQLIAANNAITQNLSSQKNDAIAKIEHLHYKKYNAETSQLTSDLKSSQQKLAGEEAALLKLNAIVSEIESTLQSEAKAIIGINNLIHIFLGRSDLKLEYREEQKKFELVRKGVPAKRLSEGEKTAIAVCYFLILVNANQEVKKNLTVVVDDPVSSLDTNNLYNAYAVLKQNLKDVGQLFVLTHNLYFFRLTTKWFKDFGSEVSYFKIEQQIAGDSISSSVRGLTKLVKETSTEYILLYCNIKSFIKKAEEASLSDADFLPYPNMLRRLIEAYLYTKQPGKENGEFEEDLTSLGVNPEIAKMADRFCNDFSHARFDSMYGQEGNSLSQAPKIIKSLVEELERIDQTHFNSMKNYI